MTTINDNLQAYPAYHACHECGGDGWTWDLNKDVWNYDPIVCPTCLGIGTAYPRLKDFLWQYHQLVRINQGENPRFIATVSGDYDCEVYYSNEYHRLRVSEVDMTWRYEVFREPGTRASGTALRSESGEFEPCQLIDFGLFLANYDLLDDTRVSPDTD